MLSILRNARFNIIWTLLRVWLGYQWLQAGLHKISDPNWMQSGVALKGFWDKSIPAIHYGWYQSFIQGLSNGGYYTWFAKLVVFGEILTGAALILGIATVFALSMGAFMNFNYMLAGSASTNPVMYTTAILLLITGPAAYIYGIDRFLLPFLRRLRGQKLSTGKLASASR